MTPLRAALTSPGVTGSVTRGFLFADLRGYTSFVERAGAHRAAVMLARYRELVREQVGRFRGAEIRTEGDSFYVVFDRASAAIECGLAIAAAAADASAANPESPIAVGVGVHAGETVETAEGYVGGAVNIAARVCAVAPANQVLVTDTVRALTTGVADVDFVAVGSRRLKGLGQPIALYRAVPAGSVAPRRSWVAPRVHLPILAAVVATAILVGSAALVASGLLGSSPVPSQFAAPTAAAAGESTAGNSSAKQSEAEPTLGIFPNEEEAALVTLIDPASRGECQRMVQEDAPRHWRPDADGTSRPHDVDYIAGIDCALGGITAPDRVWLWQLPRVVGGGSSAVPTPDEIVLVMAQRVGAAAGQCASQAPVLERWSFGTHQGQLLCYDTDTGDAVVLWTYDDETLVGKAISDDRDMDSLLAWWTEQARFGP